MNQYRILSATNSHELETQVNGHLADGYRLLGQPFSFNGKIAQAVIRGQGLVQT